jgi:hypothetical protein
LTTREVVEFLRNVILRVQSSKAPNDFIEAKDMGLLEVVVVVAIVEAVADLLRTLAELISTPSLELQHLMSVRHTKRRGFLSRATKDIVSSNARS